MSIGPQWPMTFYIVLSIIAMPIYIMVCVCLLMLRCYFKTYRSTFYTLLFQHCISDIFAMLFFIVIWALRFTPGLQEFYFEYQEYYIAAATYNSIYYFLYVRCCGIILLSIHRYLVISAPNSSITQKIQEAPCWAITISYWFLPTLLSIVVLKDVNFYYDGFETMEVVAEREVIMRNTLMALIVVASTCIVCSISYGSLFIFLRKHSVGMSRSLQRELHLAFQVLALLAAFFVMLAYYTAQNYFSRTQNSGPIYVMRSLYPIANGILSYINPFCILLLNHDFAYQFKSCLMCKKMSTSEVSKSRRHSNTHSISHHTTVRPIHAITETH